jgi:hypothetical protein
MILKVNRDALAGGTLAVFGAAVAIYSYIHYPIGVVSRMGPGMFPFVLGLALVVVAVAVLLKSIGQPGERSEINVRAGSFILASLVLFALMVKPFGVVPALLALMLVSSAAVPGRRPLGAIAFSVVVTAGIVFIFAFLMNLNLDLFGWPA